MRALIISIIIIAVLYCSFAFFFFTFNPEIWGEGGRILYLLLTLIFLWAALAIDFVMRDK